MATLPCEVCDRRTPDSTTLLCGACQQQIRTALTDIAGRDTNGHPNPDASLAADLTAARVGWTTTSRQIDVIVARDDWAPTWSDRARDAEHHLRATLVAWVRILIDQDPPDAYPTVDTYPADRIPAIAEWLLARVQRIARHDAALDAWTTITEATDRAKRAVDLPPEIACIGQCPDCSTPLYAPAWLRTIRCPACSTTRPDAPALDVAELRAAFLDLAGRYLLTASEISRVMPAFFDMQASKGHFDHWVARGTVPCRGYRRVGGRDMPVYLLADVVEAAQATAERAARRAAIAEARRTGRQAAKQDGTSREIKHHHGVSPDR